LTAKRDNSFAEEIVSIGLLFGLVAIYFAPVLAKGNEVVLSSPGTDTWSQFFYWRQFGFASLARGEIPLWNPYVFSGTPFIAGSQTAMFYPFNLLYLFFETPFAINLSIALHCFLGSLFTFFYARYMAISRPGAVIAAVIFIYGAPSLLHIFAGHLSILLTTVWLPLIFAGVEAFLRHRKMKYAVLSGIALSMQMLAGHPQYLFYSVIAVALYFVLRVLSESEFIGVPYRFAGFCLIVLTAIALAAVQILPALEFTLHSARQALSYEWVSIFSFPPENLITLLLPDFFGDMLDVPYWGKNYLWEMSIYVGVVPVFLVAVGIAYDRSRTVKIFSLLAVVSVIFALGKHTPVLRLFYAFVPGFNLFRGLSKFVFVFVFAAAMVAGFGLTKIIRLAEEGRSKLRLLAYTLLAVSLLLFLLGLFSVLFGHDLWNSLVQSYQRGEDDYFPPLALTGDFLVASMAVMFQDLFVGAVIALLLGTLLLAFAKLQRLSTKFLTVPILFLTVADLWLFGSRYLVTFSPETVSMEREVKQFLKDDKETFRLATPIFSLANAGMIEQIENVGGYDTIMLQAYSEFINFAQGLPTAEPNFAVTINAVSPLLNLLNVKYYIVESARTTALANLTLVFQDSAYKVYRNNDVLPRSFVVHDLRVVNDRKAILSQMASPGFDPKSYAIVEQNFDAMPHHEGVQSPWPKIIQHSLNRVTIDADIQQSGLLVLGDAYYPGWEAFVDGKKTEIYRTDYVLRGVVVPVGHHVVEFRYEPLSFKVGAIISLASLIMVGGFLLWSRSTFNVDTDQAKQSASKSRGRRRSPGRRGSLDR
jgi:membrane protein YfhO